MRIVGGKPRNDNMLAYRCLGVYPPCTSLADVMCVWMLLLLVLLLLLLPAIGVSRRGNRHQLC